VYVISSTVMSTLTAGSSRLRTSGLPREKLNASGG
jgi:hypothetical protein